MELVEGHEAARIVVALVAVISRRAADFVPVWETLGSGILPRRERTKLPWMHVPVRVDHHPPDARGKNLVPPQTRQGFVALRAVFFTAVAFRSLDRSRSGLIDAVLWHNAFFWVAASVNEIPSARMSKRVKGIGEMPMQQQQWWSRGSTNRLPTKTY